MRTDLGSSDAKRAGLALETTRDALVSAAWPKVKFGGEKTHVYVLANGLDFQRYFGNRLAGIFSQGKQPVFILYGSASRWELRRTAHRPTPSVLRHEMAHMLSAQVWPNQPLWFAEGLAEFLEPVFYAEDDENVIIGGINFEALGAYRGVRTLKVEDALNWKEWSAARMAQREAAGLYGLSWLFVHWLYHRHPEQLGKYVNELQRGTPADDAFKLAMQDLDLSNIDRELHEYQKFARFDDIPRPVVATPLSESSLEERLLAKEEIKEIEKLLTAMGTSATRPASHGSESPSDTPAPQETAAPPRPARRIDYQALPVLPQYPCGPQGESDGASPAESAPTAPAVSRTAGAKRPDPAGARRASQTAPPAPRGTLAPEVIQTIVRRSYAKFRACYQDGLKKTENLGGKVSIGFTIEMDGSVSGVKPECTSLPDPAVVSCIAEHFGKLKFPKPSGGIVTVVYPFLFEPND